MAVLLRMWHMLIRQLKYIKSLQDLNKVFVPEASREAGALPAAPPCATVLPGPCIAVCLPCLLYRYKCATTSCESACHALETPPCCQA